MCERGELHLSAKRHSLISRSAQQTCTRCTRNAGGTGRQALHAVGPGRVVLGLSAADNEVLLAGPVAFPFSWAASGLVVEAVGRASAAQGGGASVRGGRMHQLPAQRGAHDHHWSSMSPRKPATPAADHQFEAGQERTAARPPGEGAAAVTERPDRPSSLGVARGEVVELDSTSSGLVACCASPQGSFLHSARMKGARARVCRGSARRATPSHAAGVPGALWRADCSAACAAARRLAERIAERNPYYGVVLCTTLARSYRDPLPSRMGRPGLSIHSTHPAHTSGQPEMAVPPLHGQD